ncbi:MAG: SLC13 family permease [Syntrophaceae bacterium]|nr:SLC13 family permease [Syntrophaceae bacterium]
MAADLVVSISATRQNQTRLIAILMGIGLFTVIYCSPPWPDAMDHMGKTVSLSWQGKGAIGIFLFACVWWIFEAVPIGITGLAIGIAQALFMIRPAKEAFNDFMDPAVVFVFGCMVVGSVLTKTGVAKRFIYKMMRMAGQETTTIYLGIFALIAILTHFMSYTVVAATMYPILVVIYNLYGDRNQTSKFGMGLFMGMAYACGIGGVITLLGSAHIIVGVRFLKEITGIDTPFSLYTYYMAPVAWLMIFSLWLLFVIFLEPEKFDIPGLSNQVNAWNRDLGPITRREVVSLLIILFTIALMGLQGIVPYLPLIDKSAIILVATVMFFVFNVLNISDLELIPWNTILSLSGSMSMGYCLWKTGASAWIAANTAPLFQGEHWLVFVLGVGLFVMLAINFLMNVAVIACFLPVALLMSKQLGITPDVVMYATLVAGSMPFLLVNSAASNSIAYDSKQFTSRQFFKFGCVAGFVLMLVLAIACLVIWPSMGMATIT